MAIDHRLTEMHYIVELIERNNFLTERQQHIFYLKSENYMLKRANTGLKNRLQKLLRSAIANIQGSSLAI